MSFNFTNKVVLVTGASAGIGEGTAIWFARYGARLGLVGRNEENLRDVAARCEREKGQKALVIVADLGTDEGCEKTAKQTLDHFGRLDVLVNNAALGGRDTIQTADMAVFDRIFNIDVRGVYNLTRLLVPALIESKGNIVNVSSVVATTVMVGNLPYSMAKAAIDHFSRLIALELAPKGVRVNTVSPGLTVTKFLQRATGLSEEESAKTYKKIEPFIPLGKLCYPEHVAKMILHLADEGLSELVTGTTVQVDGGAAHLGGGAFNNALSANK